MTSKTSNAAPSNLALRIKARAEALGLDVSKAAEDNGLKRTYISDLIYGKKATFAHNKLPQVARALQWTTEELMSNNHDDKNVKLTQKNELRGTTHPANISLPDISSLTANVPVLGVAAGGVAGSFRIGDVIDYVRKPRSMSYAPNLYSLYAIGHSMEPRIFQGDPLLVNPGRPPVPDDIVIIKTQASPNAEVQAWVKAYVGETETDILAKQYNPPAQIAYKKSTVIAVERVLGIKDLIV